MNADIFFGIMLIALACWHFDEAIARYRRRRQKRCCWKDLG